VVNESQLKSRGEKMAGSKYLRILCIAAIWQAWFLALELSPRMYAAEKEKGVLVSLSANNERFGDVLGKLSKDSGYEITVNEGWRSKVVSAKLENVTLDEVLKALIEDLGRPSHLLIFDKEKKRIEIVVVAPPTSQPESAMKAEAPATMRRQPPALTSMPERPRPASRSALRRPRSMPPVSPVSPPTILDQASPPQGPAEATSEMKEPPDLEPKQGGMPVEVPGLPEREEITPEAGVEKRAIPQTRRRPTVLPE
jgi:hypothetical protein